LGQSFIVFGAVLGVGLTFFGGAKVFTKQRDAAGKYKAGKARFDRESRIDELINSGKKDE